MVAIIDFLAQGSKMFFSGLKRRVFMKRYPGNAEEICQEIVKDCWNGVFFQTSTGNFPQFWARDFGWCTKSLMELGYKEEVHKTLRYALNRFKQYGGVRTTISPRGKPWDFPVMAVDSLPWLIHSIKISKFPYYSYKNFLNKQIQKYFDAVVNEHTGLVKPDMHFSSMKDYAIRRSACYDNCMVGLLAKDLKGMKLINPFSGYKYGEIIVRHFWSGHFFYDDLAKKEYIAGDANLFPFLLGLVSDEKKLKKAIEHVELAGLDDPWPLKYTASREGVKFIWQEFLARNYESNALWMHMAPLYVQLVKQVDAKKAEQLKKKLGSVIELYGNYLEVFTAKGKPYNNPFYYCDAGMLWAANYVRL